MNTRSALVVILLLIGGLARCHLTEARAAEFATPKETLEWFQDARFGVFIHWDPRVLTVPRYGKSYRQLRGDIETIHDIYQYWNPERFDADQWLRVFQKAGARYITFTSKHQYGFCNFDNPYTTGLPQRSWTPGKGSGGQLEVDRAQVAQR